MISNNDFIGALYATNTGYYIVITRLYNDYTPVLVVITDKHYWMDGWMDGWMGGWMDGWVD